MLVKRNMVGEVIEGEARLTLAELASACSVHAEWVVELVGEGVLEPTGVDPRRWRFGGRSLGRARTVLRLQRDLGANLAGAALALELIEEIERLRARLRTGEPSFPGPHGTGETANR